MKFGVSLVVMLFISQVELAKKGIQYVFTNEHAYMAYENPEMINVTIRFYKITREQGALNATITVKQVYETVKMRLESHQFLGSEFKKIGNIDFEMDFCPVFAKKSNYFGFQNFIFKCPDANVTECPMMPGTYYICQVSPQLSDLPPVILVGRWLFKLTFSQYGVVIAVLNWILRVTEILP